MSEELQVKFNLSLDSLLKGLEIKKIAIALSGGPDSNCLLHLTIKWAKLYGIEIRALTVNHHLRPSSTEEAQSVKALCSKLKLQHVILDWKCKHQLGGIEEKARNARYELMTQHCAENDIAILLTGQTMDDMIENFFIRLTRGSGILGLSGNLSLIYNNIRVCRPLSRISKDKIFKYLNENNIVYDIDNTNLNPNFSLRNEIRHKLHNFLDSKFISKDLYKERIMQSLTNIDNDFEIIKDQFCYFLKDKVEISNFGSAYLDRKSFEGFNSQVLYYILSYLTTVIGGNLFTPKSNKIYRAMTLIRSGRISNINLHNTIIKCRKNTVIIYKEPNSFAPMEDMSIKLIDNRFTIDQLPCGYYISKLSKDEYLDIKYDIVVKKAITNLLYNITAILFTIPVLKNLEKNIIIPHIGYSKKKINLKVAVKFTPKYMSKFFF